MAYLIVDTQRCAPTSRDQAAALIECFPAAKGVFVDFHVDALASKLYAFHAESKALFCCCFAS